MRNARGLHSVVGMAAEFFRCFFNLLPLDGVCRVNPIVGEALTQHPHYFYSFRFWSHRASNWNHGSRLVR